MSFRSILFSTFIFAAAVPVAQAQVSDFTVMKKGPATAFADNDVTFTITVTNNGPNAGAVTVNDPIAGGWSFVSVAPPAGFLCSNPGAGATSGTVTCTAASMAPLSSADIDIVFHIPGTTPSNTSFTNTVTVSSPTDPDNGNNSASATTITPLVSDLTVLKTGPSTATSDTDVSYTITVTNNGPDAANSVTLNDVVSGGWSFVSVTPAAGFSCMDPGAGATTGMVTCTSQGGMSPGSTATFTIVFHIPPATPPGTTFTNVATVSSPTDPDSENNASAAQTTTPPLPVGDVAISKSGPASAAPGTDVVYTITVTNNGPSAAQNVSWTDTLPAGTPPTWPMTFVSFSQTSGPAFSCTPGATVTCSVATLAANATATFDFVGHIPSDVESGTTYSNAATVTSNNDPSDENNIGATSLTVRTADLGVNKTGPATAVAGGPAYTYVVTLSNSGPDDATDVSFSDPLPAGVAFVSVVQNSGPAATCGGGTTVTCSISLLAKLQTAQFTITVQPLPTTANGAVLSNTATASTSSADPNGANNTSTVTTTVSTQADVSINKSGPATAIAGNNITYTITVGNAGPSNAANVSWTDTLPANTTFVSETQNSGPTFNCTTGATVSCSIATLASGANATFTIVAQVAPSTASGTTLTNTASVTTTTSDATPGNNSSTLITTVSTQADVSIVKSAPPAAGAGTNMTYTITVASAGPSTAANVSWTDTLPANTTFVSENQTTGPTFTCTTGTTVSCNIATFASGASATFAITVQVSPSAASGSTITNTATVTSTTSDAITGNNSSTAATTVATSTNLSVTKSGPSTTPSNTTAAYSVTVSNGGPSDAASVTLTDSVPANMTFASVSQTAGPAFNCTTPAAGGTGAVTCTIASLASGAVASFQFVFNVSPGTTPGTMTTNTATVSATTPDTNPADNSASVTTTIAQSIPALSALMMMALTLVIAALALAALRR